MTGRVVISGIVYINKESQKRYLKATCQGSLYPAKLEVFAVDNESNSAGSKLQELSFTDVKNIKEEFNKETTTKLITFELQNGEGLTFHTKSAAEHKRWLIYSRLLAIIPTYPVPNELQHNLQCISLNCFRKPNSFNAEDDVWTVYIVNEGLGHSLGWKGFHHISLNKNGTLSIINGETKVSVAIWDNDKIRQSGCVGSLVFLEAGRRCFGGPGILWMYCPGFSLTFRQSLHNSFLLANCNKGAINASPPPVKSHPDHDITKVSFDCQTKEVVTPILPHFASNSVSSFSDNLFLSLAEGTHRHLCKTSSVSVASEKLHPVLHLSKSVPIEVLSNNTSACEGVVTQTRNIQEQSETNCISISHNLKDTTTLYKPSFPTRKFKPPIPPRTVVPASVTTNAQATAAGRDLAASSLPIANGGNQDPTTDHDVQVSVHSGQHKQLNTHEMVMLKQHPTRTSLHRCGNVNDIEHCALVGCWVQLSEKLDIASLVPFLCSHYLLTPHDREKLTCMNMTNSEKTNYLLNILPKKDKGWFDKFLHCLSQSTEGTSHASLVKELQLKHEELRNSTSASCQLNMQTITGFVHEKTSTKRPRVKQEVFPIYLELQDCSSPYVFNVTSTELVESLMDKIRGKLNINSAFDLKLKVNESQKFDSKSSLRESHVERNSFITVVAHDRRTT